MKFNFRKKIDYYNYLLKYNTRVYNTGSHFFLFFFVIVLNLFGNFLDTIIPKIISGFYYYFFRGFIFQFIFKFTNIYFIFKNIIVIKFKIAILNLCLV